MIAYFGVPLNWPDGTAFGSFCMLDNQPQLFDQQHKEMLNKFRHVIEMLLQQAFDQRRLCRLINTDTLTGITGQKHSMERFAEEFARAKRYGMPLTFIYMDVDNFKSINDFHGHQWGDRVLKTFTTEVARAVRGIDLFGRSAGEAFMLGLPNTDHAGAMVVAERILPSHRITDDRHRQQRD